MKDKILYLVLGILIGAVITAAGFLIYSRTNTSSNQMGGGRDSSSEMRDFKNDGNMVMPDGVSGAPSDASTTTEDTTDSSTTEATTE